MNRLMKIELRMSKYREKSEGSEGSDEGDEGDGGEKKGGLSKPSFWNNWNKT
jgi:hypothetical protein